jgi:hypothetical protein
MKKNRDKKSHDTVSSMSMVCLKALMIVVFLIDLMTKMILVSRTTLMTFMSLAAMIALITAMFVVSVMTVDICSVFQDLGDCDVHEGPDD